MLGEANPDIRLLSLNAHDLLFLFIMIVEKVFLIILALEIFYFLSIKKIKNSLKLLSNAFLKFFNLIKYEIPSH